MKKSPHEALAEATTEEEESAIYNSPEACIGAAGEDMRVRIEEIERRSHDVADADERETARSVAAAMTAELRRLHRVFPYF